MPITPSFRRDPVDCMAPQLAERTHPDFTGIGGHARSSGYGGAHQQKQFQHTNGFYKPHSHYYQQQQATQQMDSSQPAPQYRPVVKRSSGLYAVKFVSNGPLRTSWVGEGVNGHPNPDSGPGSNRGPVQAAYPQPAASHYAVGQSDSSSWYGNCDQYRPAQRAPAAVPAMIQVTAGRGDSKGVSFGQAVSPSSQAQWARGWTEPSRDWQYQQHHASSFYGNGDSLPQQDPVPATHYSQAWDYGYSQDGNSFSSYGSSQVVVAGAPQQLGQGRAMSDHSGLWGGGRY